MMLVRRRKRYLNIYIHIYIKNRGGEGKRRGLVVWYVILRKKDRNRGEVSLLVFWSFCGFENRGSRKDSVFSKKNEYTDCTKQ